VSNLVPHQTGSWNKKEQRESKLLVLMTKVTATLAGTLSGKLIPLQILYPSHPSQMFPSGSDIWHTLNNRAYKETTPRFIENWILLYNGDVCRKSSTPDQFALVIFDVFKGHVWQCILENNKILQVHAPNSCTDLFQSRQIKEQV